MIETVLLYQFSFFAPGTQVDPSPDIIVKLMEGFKGKDLMPTTTAMQVLQINIGSGPSAAPTQTLQLQFVTKNQAWNLAFEPQRVLLTHNNRPDVGIGTPEDFIAEVVEIFSRLLQVISLTGTRLSYVTKGLLPAMSPEALEQVNLRLLNLPAYYREHPPLEWTTRNVARHEVGVGDKAEIINVITDIGRVKGMIEEKGRPQPFDRIMIGFDINTFQENKTPRFGYHDVGLFLREAVKISQMISEEIGEKFNG